MFNDLVELFKILVLVMSLFFLPFLFILFLCYAFSYENKGEEITLYSNQWSCVEYVAWVKEN